MLCCGKTRITSTTYFDCHSKEIKVRSCTEFRGNLNRLKDINFKPERFEFVFYSKAKKILSC